MNLAKGLCTLALAMCLAAGTARADDLAPQRISLFSGKPVPRFESLQHDLVNGRSGPSLAHPIRWQYERRGLPMLILKESEDWRFVEDPDGARVWVHERMFSETLTAIVLRETVVRAGPAEDARGLVRLAPGAIVEVMSDTGGWLRVSADGHRGWTPVENLWGRQQVRPADAAAPAS